MISPATQSFTAADIARALDKAPRSIRRALDGVPHSTIVPVNGMEAKAWTLAALPRAMREQLDAEAKRQHCRDACALLNAPVRQAWQPKIPLNEVADDCRTKAVKLQRALLPALENYERGDMAGADLEQLGRDAYKREFGHEISARTWRFLFQRARERARNADDYARVDLFLDDNCARKREMPKALSFDETLGPLHRLITGFADPTAPTSTEAEALWYQACKLFHAHAATAGAKKFKRSLLAFLWNMAPTFAASEEALRRNFDRKYERLVTEEFQPRALRDHREAKAGENRAPAFSQADLDTILTHSLFNCGARLAQGIRELRELSDQSGLSRDMRKYLGHEFTGTEPRSKSYVPQRLRDAIRHDLEMLKPYRIGARAADAASAWVKRDWSGVPSMYALSFDDLTAPVYFWHHDKTGKRILTRGQVIAAVDCRSLKVLGFSLQPDRNYSAAVIRSLITKICSEQGLPRVFGFERGIWESAKLLKGNAAGRAALDADMPFSSAECEHGLLEFGVRIIHSVRPRSKLVERFFGLLQDLMEGEPGYCGRNEREDRPEDLSAKMYAVEHGEDPSQWFYSFDQWTERLAAICDKYNTNRQDGELLKGTSPNDAFEQHQDEADPPMHFGPQCRYLLAHQKITKTVGRNGITLRYGKEAFVYHDEQTGKLIGQTLLAWFDPETPEHIVITDMNRKNPICVERAAAVPALDTDSEIFQHEIAKARAHSSYGKARFRVVKALHRQSVRRVVPDRAAAELGARIDQLHEQKTTAQKQTESLHRKAARLLERLGMPTALARDATEDQVRGWEEMLQVERAATIETEQTQ